MYRVLYLGKLLGMENLFQVPLAQKQNKKHYFEGIMPKVRRNIYTLPFKLHILPPVPLFPLILHKNIYLHTQNSL